MVTLYFAAIDERPRPTLFLPQASWTAWSISPTRPAVHFPEAPYCELGRTSASLVFGHMLLLRQVPFS